jgi:Cu+-exporting ATPase
MSTELETKTFKINGITCMDCITHIADRVKRLPGAHKISGNLTQSTVKVGFEPDKVSVGQIIEAIEDAGYGVDGVEA